MMSFFGGGIYGSILIKLGARKLPEASSLDAMAVLKHHRHKALDMQYYVHAPVQ